MLVFAIVLTQACKKKKDPEPEQVEQPAPATPVIENSAEYAKLKIGNYWIYQEINIDAQGNETPTTNYDSCYIAKDTIIHGSTFFWFKNFSPLFSYQEFLRDSSNHIINSHGEIIFAANDFTTIFASGSIVDNQPSGDTIYKYIHKMTNKDAAITLPAGNFTASNFQKKYNIHPNWAQGVPVRYMNTRFAKNVGMITQTLAIFLSITSTVERRLVRYHLN